VSRKPPQPHQGLADTLRRLVNSVLACMKSHDDRPALDGIAHREWIAGAYGSPAWGWSPVESGDMQALLSLRAAGDHALALADVLGRRQAASLTLGRGALEAAAWAAYLADAEVGAEERARRQVNEVLFGVSEQGRGLFDYGDIPESERQRERIEAILTAATGYPQWGKGKSVPKDWRSSASVGAPRPNVMTLIDRLLATDDGKKFGSRVYRVSSAVAHASPHGFLLAGAVMSSRDGQYQVPDPEPWARERWASLHLATVGGFYNAWLAVARRMSWDEARIRDIATEVLAYWFEAGKPGSAAALLL
jgi:hypothetical protein